MSSSRDIMERTTVENLEKCSYRWAVATLKRLPALLTVLAALAIFAIGVTCAMPVNDGHQVGGSSASLGLYTVVLDDMPPADAQAARASIEALVRASGGQLVYTYSLIDAVDVRVPAGAVGAIQGTPGVKYVDAGVRYETQMDQAVDQIGVRDVWSGARAGWASLPRPSGDRKSVV